MNNKILLVEDSEEDFITIQRAFKKAKINKELIRVENGDDAISAICNLGDFSSKEDYPKPDIIILDLNLPGMSGKEVLQFLKKDDSFCKIPVIIFTTSADSNDIDECYRSGANSYMQKPLEFEGFLELFSQLDQYWYKTSKLPDVS